MGRARADAEQGPPVLVWKGSGRKRSLIAVAGGGEVGCGLESGQDGSFAGIGQLPVWDGVYRYS